MVIEQNASITVNTVIESISAIFDENRFSAIPTPNDRIPSTMSLSNGQEQGDIVEIRSKQIRKQKSFGSDFFVYLVEGTRDSIENEISYVYNISSNLSTFKEAMESQDVPFWKEVVQDKIDSIMKNNTWVLVNLAPG